MNVMVPKCTTGSASCQDAGTVDIFVKAYIDIDDSSDVNASTEVRSGLCEFAL